MRMRMNTRRTWGDRRQRTESGPQSPASRLPPRAVRPALHQILLGDGGAETVVVLDEFADELVHSLLENLLHAAVLEPGAHGAGLALGRTLAAIGAGDVVEIEHEVLVAARERARHLIAQDEEIGDQPGLDALAVDPVVGGERRDRAQDRRPLEIVERAADALVRR